MTSQPNQGIQPATINPLRDVVLVGTADGFSLPSTVTPITSSTFTVTRPVVPATTNCTVILTTNLARKGAIVYNPGPSSIFIQQASTGVTTGNGLEIPAGSSYNIDEPLYTGSFSAIVATGTQTISVAELT